MRRERDEDCREMKDLFVIKEVVDRVCVSVGGAVSVMFACVCAWVCVCVCVHVHVHMRVCARVHVCVCVCVLRQVDESGHSTSALFDHPLDTTHVKVVDVRLVHCVSCHDTAGLANSLLEKSCCAPRRALLHCILLTRGIILAPA